MSFKIKSCTEIISEGVNPEAIKKSLFNTIKGYKKAGSRAADQVYLSAEDHFDKNGGPVSDEFYLYDWKSNKGGSGAKKLKES